MSSNLSLPWLFPNFEQTSQYISCPHHLDTHLKSLHGRADLAIVNLLIEHITEAIDTAPILSCDDKAVELWVPGMLLCAKLQAMRQA